MRPNALYCSRCSRDLSTVSASACPACGKPFDRSNRLTYSAGPFDPRAFARSQRRHALVFVALCLSGLLILSLLIYAMIRAALPAE